MFHIKHSNNIWKALSIIQIKVGLPLNEIILKVEPTKEILSKTFPLIEFFSFSCFLLWEWPRVLIIATLFHCVKWMYGVWDIFHLLWTYAMDFVSHHMVTLCEVQQSTISLNVS